MLVFLSLSWERKPVRKEGDEGEAQAGVRVPCHGPAHDQIKEWYLFWHHNGRDRYAAECAVGVKRIEQECKWEGPNTYLHVHQLTEVWKPELQEVLLCGVTIKEFSVNQKTSWQQLCHTSASGSSQACRPQTSFWGFGPQRYEN